MKHTYDEICKGLNIFSGSIYIKQTTALFFVSKLDGDVRSDEFEDVACFEKYDDCLRKYQSLVLQHLENTIPVAELFKHLKKTDLDNVVGLAGEKITDDEDDERRWEKIWSALIRYRHPIIKECIEKIQVLYDVKISGWDK